MPDLLPLYARAGMHKLKIGDDAIVDVANFTLEGRTHKEFRNTLTRLEKAGVAARMIAPPVSERDLTRLKEVSDEWLRLPGRRERQFTLGIFDRDYLRDTPIYVAEDRDGRLLGFANLVPSFAPGEATIDLMRRRTEAPNGLMDYLFVRLLLLLKEQGKERFNLGMAPMSGFQEREEATREERAIHAFFRHMTFLFSYTGLRAYKAKFATSWEPRYLIFKNVLDLPRVAIAIERVSERTGRRHESPED
jgi:phosphatidylglycerol lysyltransferase